MSNDFFPKEMETDPVTTKIAPNNPSGVICSAVTSLGASQAAILIDPIVKIGAKAKIALTLEASQC